MSKSGIKQEEENQTPFPFVSQCWTEGIEREAKNEKKSNKNILNKYFLLLLSYIEKFIFSQKAYWEEPILLHLYYSYFAWQ